MPIFTDYQHPHSQPPLNQVAQGNDASALEKVLITSIHDVSPRFESEIDWLLSVMDKFASRDQTAMLVVPNHWGDSPIIPGSGFATKLRSHADLGADIFVHGWYHADSSAHAGIAAMKSRFMTKNEGEFLGLNKREAARRMANGQKLIEDICGKAVTGFIAPAWLYGSGAMDALADSDFELAEDHFRVWQPRTGKVLARGPVVTWASRSALRTASSLASAKAARTLLQLLRVVRIAVHPGDTTKPSIMRSIERTIQAFSDTREVNGYGWFLDDA